MNLSDELPRLWYGTADALAPAAEEPAGVHISLTVAVQPAAFSNAVNVYYSVDCRPERVLRAYVVRHDDETNTEYFRADFPFIAPGSSVTYVARLLSVGRVFSSNHHVPKSFTVQCPVESQVNMPTKRFVGPGPRFGYDMEFLANVHIPIELKPEVIGVTPDGLRVDFYVKGGTMIGPNIHAKFTHHGGDWMRIRQDGIGIADIHASLETDSGERILAEYSGVLDLGKDGYENAIRGIYPPNPPAVVTPRFLTPSPKYQWLNRLQCYGTGFFDTQGPVLNYDMYSIHPRMLE
jgi:hypothetical protein